MAESKLAQNLKRLFSGTVIVRNIGGRKLKVIDTDNVQSTVNRNFMDRYTRLYSTMGGSTGRAIQFYQAGQRMALFKDYEQMDSDAILSSALDIYADESTMKSEYGDVIEITAEDEAIRETLHNLYYDILNVEFNLWPWVRNMCKYGDFFLHLQIDDNYGIYNVVPMSAYDVVRLEGLDPARPNEVKFQLGEGETRHGIKGNDDTEMLEDFEVAHFRLHSDSNFLPYGKSMIEGARKVWKQLTLMEDAMLIHRIMRAPEKRIFKLDIGNIAPNEVEPFMKSVIAKMKKTPVIDQTTGEYNLKYNMQNLTEDFFLPVRGSDSGTEIDTLGGLEYDSTDDIEYLKNKMMAALKVPRAFLGYDEALNSKSTLAAEDVRFAKTIERIQRVIVDVLMKIGVVHLYAQGHRDEKMLNFDLNLTNSSIMFEEERLELLNNKISAASSLLQDDLAPTSWIYDNIFKFGKAEQEQIRLELIKDKKRKFRYQQIEDEGNDPLKSGEAVGTQGAMMDAGGEEGGGEKPPVPGGAQEENYSDYGEDQEVPKGGFEGGGRPKEGPKYGKDGSVTGRDPIGKHDMKKNASASPKYGKTLSLAHYASLKKRLGEKFVEKNQKILNETEDIEKEYKDDISENADAE